MTGVFGLFPKHLSQFMTREDVALACVDYLVQKTGIPLSDYSTIVEPACGNGAFVHALKKRMNGDREYRLVYMDIDSSDMSRRKDFLSERIALRVPPEGSQSLTLTIGFPPVGGKCKSCVEFFNKASEYSDIIAFIYPQTINKNNVVKRFNCYFEKQAEISVPKNSFTVNTVPFQLDCVFQIWKKTRTPRPAFKTPFVSDFEFVKRDEAPDIAIRRVGSNAGAIYLSGFETYSTDSNYFIRIINQDKQKVIQNLQALCLETCAEKYLTLSTPSLGKYELCQLYNNKFQ